jgi:hypothetical protein
MIMKEPKGIVSKALKQGQQRPYADSEFEFIIESQWPKDKVYRYCTETLRPNEYTYEAWQNAKDLGSYFVGYHQFTDLGNGRYRYYVCEPYTG